MFEAPSTSLLLVLFHVSIVPKTYKIQRKGCLCVNTKTKERILVEKQRLSTQNPFSVRSI